MFDAAERRGWVEAMKELKSQYYVGSQDAFRYLKAMRWYEQVRQDILRANPSLAQKFDLSVKMVAWWVRAICRVLQHVLDCEVIKVSIHAKVALERGNHVITPFEESEIVEQLRLSGDYNMWTLDFPACLVAFMTDSLSAEIDNGLLIALAKWLRKNFRNGRFCPIFTESSQPVSFSQFRSDKKFRNNDEHDFWIAAHEMLDDAIECENHIFTPADHLLLSRAEDANDIRPAYSLLQKLLMRDKRGQFQHFKYQLLSDFKSSSCAADRFLYSSRLYLRAEHEYTLGSIEVERRIALNDIHSFDLKGMFPTPTDLVEAILNQRLSTIHTIRNRLRFYSDIIRTDGVHELLSTQVSNDERTLKHFQYLYRALHQNKKWLIDFLSH